MKNLRKSIMTFAVVAGLAFNVFTVSGQKDDQKKPPKDPPVITPREKPPRGNPPKGGGGPKKPGRDD